MKNKRSIGVIQCIITLISVLFLVHVSYAHDDIDDQFTTYLNEEKINITLAIPEASRWIEPSDMHASQDAMEHVKQLNVLMQAKIAVFEQFLLNQQNHQRELSAQLKKLEQSPSFPNDDAHETHVRLLNMRQETATKAIELIQQDLSLARQYQAALSIQAHQLVVWQTAYQTKEKLNVFHEKIATLEKERAALYEKNIALEQEQKISSFSQNARLNYEKTLFVNNQHILLIDDEIKIFRWQIDIEKLNDTYIKHQDISALKTMIMLEEKMIEQLLYMQTLTNNQSHFSFCINIKKIANVSLKQACSLLRNDVSLQSGSLRLRQEQLQQDLIKKQILLRKQLASRQHLTEYSTHVWSDILNQTARIPTQLYQYLVSLVMSTADQYIEKSLFPALEFWVILILIGILSIFLRYKLSFFEQNRARARLSAHLYDGLMTLFYRTIPQLTGFAMIITALLLNQVPYGHYRLLTHLMYVWLICLQFVLIARLTLLERVTDASEHDALLYYRLKWLILVGGCSTGLMIISHELPLSFLLQDVFDRLFMLFLLTVSGVAWHSREAILHVFPSVLMNNKPHVRHAVLLLRLLIPVTVFTTALIGLMGYINLAWSMSRYQVYFLVIITSYILVRGLVRDGLDLLSEWMVNHLHNGWLWVESLLKPIDKLLRLSLLGLSCYVLLDWMDLLSDPQLSSKVNTMSHYSFIHWAGVHISLLSLLEFVILLAFFIWASRWSREFCYRWLYARVLDAGIRNSLSVFTQYSIVLLGCVVTLRVLGVDFTGMMVVIGGLAVGMGFGLRDFASNIIGGLMLLIERPVREGDLITIGEYEGRVAHIGIRSMRVSSWDNMEVLIPNAETFNKPFTNWTHQDSIVRTVVPIKVNRADDPLVVQQMLHGVLINISEVLHEPSPQVFLKQIDEALIEFEVRYFINVQLHTRFEVRSKILFAIMAEFKKQGIKPPIPPFSVELTPRGIDPLP